MTVENKLEKSPPLLDRGDSRVKHAVGFRGVVQAFIDRVRSGDLGSLPVVIGLIIIWSVFGYLNPIFFSSNNLVNLLFDCSTVGVIALGIVCVLMVGEIDLSVGSISGFASAILGTLWVSQQWPVALAILAAIVFGGLIGALYALLFNRLGMPSFVSHFCRWVAIWPPPVPRPMTAAEARTRAVSFDLCAVFILCFLMCVVVACVCSLPH